MTRSPKRSLPLKNARQKMDGRELLASVADSAAAAVFLDPQYRGVLDELAFGNEGVRQKRRAQLPQMSDADIQWFVREAIRIVKPSGHLFLWVDKFTIGTGAHRAWVHHLLPAKVVDLIAWQTLRFGMGKRTRGATEYLVVVQKSPTRADVWNDHRIRDCWSEYSDQTIHPHAKPYQLTERLIRSVTKQGDLVVDPCAGGYVVLEACKITRREFLGCDLRG